MVEQSRPNLDDIFHALADVTRRGMVQQLSGGTCSISELSHPYDMSLAAASKHVKVLEGAGLVRREIRGRIHRCSLDRGPVARAADWLRAYTVFWDDRLDALEALMHERKKGVDGRD